MAVLCPPGLPGPAPGLPGIPGMNAQALSLLQQQIFNQYALFSSLPDPPKQNIKTTFPAMSPSLHPALMSPNQVRKGTENENCRQSVTLLKELVHHFEKEKNNIKPNFKMYS